MLKVCGFLALDAVQFGESATFRRDIPTPYSGSESKPHTDPAEKQAAN
jgi:hypothetical protein